MNFAITAYLNRREISGGRRAVNMHNVYEHAYLNRISWEPQDLLEPSPLIISTISIALAPDGKTFASTHGDHTIKVFDAISHKLLRVFFGHPRTPWTVKYNPQDPDIIVSGCLGQEVRVWSISQGICLNHTSLNSSIISSCFHPNGDLVVVSTGYDVITWDWRENLSPEHGGYQPSKSPYPYRRIVTHSRNIRAVTIHPGGEYMLIAAPNAPRTEVQPTFTPCRLFVVPFSLVLSPGMDIIALSEMVTIIPEIHLYSDGGIDISLDGNFLVTCAKVGLPYPIESRGKGFGQFTHPSQSKSDPIQLQLRKKQLEAQIRKNPMTQLNSETTTEELSLLPSIPSFLPLSWSNTSEIGELDREDGLISSSFFGWPRIVESDCDDIGLKCLPCICVLKLLASNQTPLVEHCLPISENLMKAITSTKLSPTGRKVLVGYGVRTQGRVKDHVDGRVACEVLSLTDNFGLTSTAVIPSEEDEVNVAQFQTIPGYGIVYGTKRGKVRGIMKRSSPL